MKQPDVKEFNNIKEIILNSKEKFGDNVAFRIKHQVKKEISYEDITYNKFVDDIYAYGTGLYDLGLKNKRIALFGKNRYEWILTHSANMFGSMVSVTLDKGLQDGELEESLVRSKADAIVFDDKLAPLIKKIRDNRAGIRIKNETYSPCLSRHSKSLIWHVRLRLGSKLPQGVSSFSLLSSF